MDKGDVVRLAGAEQKMTVEGFDAQDRAMCVWFDSQENLRRGTFDKNALVECERTFS